MSLSRESLEWLHSHIVVLQEKVVGMSVRRHCPQDNVQLYWFLVGLCSGLDIDIGSRILVDRSLMTIANDVSNDARYRHMKPHIVGSSPPTY